MDTSVKYLFFVIVGFLIGYFAFNRTPEIETHTVTEIKTDTVFVTIRDTVRLTRKEIKQEFLRDTVLIEPIQPVISSFKASTPFLYGNTYVSGEVLGTVLKMDITNDFNIPTVTNTITTTNTVVKNPFGLYVVLGYNPFSQSPSVGAVFVKNKILIGVSNSSFQFGYKIHK